MLSTLWALFAAFLALTLQGTADRAGQIGPPTLPFEDAGACPFEGCVYREWTVKAPVAILTERKDAAPVAFRLAAGERVSALTGVVITMKPGRVRFREASSLDTLQGQIRVLPGDVLYLLTYQGEGFSKVWFHGRVYTDVDVTGFVSGRCEAASSRCAGQVLERSTTQWWVRIRDRLGREGWTRETAKFDGKDALA
jgi:hypothetical protein